MTTESVKNVVYSPFMILTVIVQERPITDFMHFSTEDRKAAVSR